MNWFLLIIVIILALALAWIGWRYFILRRSMQRYAALLHSIANGEKSVSDLPEDFPALEDFSNAVKTLALVLRVRTSVADAERARLAAVLDRMTDGVLIADASGQIQFANPAVEHLFETSQAIGRRLVEVLRQHQLVEAWQRSRETGEAQEESIELPARRRFLQLVVLPDRQTGGSLLLVQDLTRVRRLETVRRDFISNVSHELRTPLASLKALTETLRDGALEDPQAAPRFLSRIETEVDALAQMATELLELSRIESGQVPLKRKAMPAATLLLSAAERMRAQVERAGLVLRLDTAQDMTEVSADSPRLEQVLVNLIHNAIKFTPPGGQVVLAAQTEAGFVRFSVRDSGVGIPADDLERIFERFYKADRARSGGGTGLGLSISRHLVEAHGGRIWAESTEGAGSTFYFTIPISS
ncbi:MAG TPA: ATP-binding protein [Anaerolineales bacterium]|nr:ATP-binding protein [Anaerolineales bacterium]